MKARTFLPLIVALVLLASVLPAIGQRSSQLVFATPEAAVEALVAALRDNNEKALLDIFGHEHEDVLVQKDKAAAREYRGRLFRAAEVSRRLETEGNDRLVLVIGREAWPFPIPLMRDASGWRFDTQAGVEEIINRRIGRFELNAIAVCRAYIDAQRQYASKRRDGSPVHRYAQRIGSSPGKQDGLYWDEATAPAGEISPFGPLVAQAQPLLDGRKPGDPYQGYYFRILTAQGPNAPGGRYSYIINGNMIAGFAMVAFPADYDSSGVMTFLCSHHGDVLQKDLGERTAKIGRTLKEYNPDSTWTKVEE
jgi:hypothetical protein